ncbi:MAG: hypothetical protein LBQ23_03970 [Puniceicoccales bacterium]|jgi:hypothetical protein|nr:hypothetical protein [Puniceicoccales bacterium]
MAGRLYFGDILELVHETPSFGDWNMMNVLFSLLPEITLVVHVRDSMNSIKSDSRNLLAPHSLIDFNPG